MSAAAARYQAAVALAQVLANGVSLNEALPAALSRTPPPARALVQECCYGVLRWYPTLTFLRDRLLDRPLKAKEQQVNALLLVGLYQLRYLRVPDHAAVAETVAATEMLKKPWARGLVNAVLRGYLRQRDTLESALGDDPVATAAHPAWLLTRLQQDWPQDWPAIITANNSHPPQGLRVNLRQGSRADYLAQLHAVELAATPAPHTTAGIVLATPCDVARLPGFAEGWVSVQDPAAQLAAELLAVQPGQRVLDACAAPGGKTCHILERTPDCDLLALDNDAARLRRVEENLHRLHLHAQLKTGDALAPATWWDGRPFDRILLDAPCSASGVIRRHPDIKQLRQPADIAALAQRQQALLERLWPLLAPGGRLVYATCSVFKQENEQTLAQFLATGVTAQEHRITADWGCARPHGRQILPGTDSMDGFFYAVLDNPP